MQLYIQCPGVPWSCFSTVFGWSITSWIQKLPNYSLSLLFSLSLAKEQLPELQSYCLSLSLVPSQNSPPKSPSPSSATKGRLLCTGCCIIFTALLNSEQWKLNIEQWTAPIVHWLLHHLRCFAEHYTTHSTLHNALNTALQTEQCTLYNAHLHCISHCTECSPCLLNMVNMPQFQCISSQYSEKHSAVCSAALFISCAMPCMPVQCETEYSSVQHCTAHLSKAVQVAQCNTKVRVYFNTMST